MNASQPILTPAQLRTPNVTALAPMQDVTTLPFMSVINHYGAPDYFFTEYFRVHESSKLEKHILASITENPSDRPVFAQLIGENLEHIGRTMNALKTHPIAGIDLNMGCPAPKVYRKKVGGGLLRDMAKIDQLLGFMRSQWSGLFTVKMRIGFENTDHFETLLQLINKHGVDLLSLHGRTVKEMYRSEVHYAFIKRAVEAVQCPVFANGNITSLQRALWTLDYTQATGVMVGRSAIRNPWIFRQIREHLNGLPVFEPTLEDVRDYIERLFEATDSPKIESKHHAARMKKFLNFVGQGVEPEGTFLKAMRRSKDRAELAAICDQYLLGDNARTPFASEPYPHLVARPNRESTEHGVSNASCASMLE